MAQVRWLTIGERSKTTLITAPRAPAGVDEGAERLDAALAGFTGPIPGWFRGFERLGAWWYPIWAVAGGLIAFALVSTALGVAAGMTAGLVLAYLSAFTINIAAQARARRTGSASSTQVIAEVDLLARIAPTGARDLADAVLKHDARLEHQVHSLLWRSVKQTRTADGDTAAAELRALLEQTAPDHAAERSSAARRLEEQIKQLKEDGKL